MAAGATDKFKKLTNNFSTTLSGAIVGSSDSSMSLASTTNLPTDTGSVFVIDRVNSSGTATPTLREYVVGTVSGSNVTNLIRGVGNSTAQAHSTGAVVEQVVDQRTINDLMDGILAQHNQDGTHGVVTATSVATTGAISAGGSVSGTTGVFTSDVSDNSTTLKTIRAETIFDHVASGCLISADSAGSTLNYSMTSGVVYIGGKRVAVSSFSAHAGTASKDMYVDVDNTGTITHTPITNNAASQTLAANSIRLGIVVCGASSIASSASINQGQETMLLPIASSTPYAVTDSLGNLICPRDPSRRILGERRITSAFSTSSTSFVAVTGLSVPVIVPTGRKVKVCVYGSTLSNNTTVTTSRVAVYSGASINTLTTVLPIEGQSLVTGANYQVPVYADGLTTPASNSIFYTVALDAGAGTASFAGGDFPFGFIRVELV